jgi:glycosyltransferase involved in cell wall biosynthesis
MADQPLVSVITPSWRRHDLLLNRCVPSVQAQTYGNVEHVVISDGPDPELAAVIREWRQRVLDGEPRPMHDVQFREMPEHDPAARWGHRARLRGLELAKGDYIAYLDDDNAFRPGHVARLVAALEADPGAGFAYSLILMNGHGPPYAVGADPPFCGGIDTSAIMHRRGLLETATWRDDGWQETVDWDLVARWMSAGATWVFDGEITADYYFNG